MLKCLICSNSLKGKQTMYCGRACKNIAINKRHQVYSVQKERGFNVKLKLIELKGSKCSVCNYNKNSAALCFHHTKDKKFQIDMRKCSNTKWESLVEEVNKCILLCHNCHMELHHPTYSI